MSLRRLTILLALGCLLGTTALAAAPDYSVLGVTNGQDLGTSIYRNTDGSVRKLINQERVPAKGTPAEIASRYVAANAQALFGAPATDKAGDLEIGPVTFRLLRATSSLSGEHVWLQGYVGDVPIERGYVITHLTHDGKVLFVTNELGDVAFEPTATVANLDRGSALAAATDLVGSDGRLRGAAKAELVIHRDGDVGRLAWRLELPAYKPYGDWEVLIDALNGAEISRRDLIISHRPDQKPTELAEPAFPPVPDPVNLQKGAKVNGAGMVFIANPLNNHADRYSWRDGNAVIDTARDNVALTNLSGSGLLAGSWVEVFNTDAARANEPSLTYNYSALIANGHFQEVNVYYHINTWQEYIQSLGITNARARVTNCYAHQGEDDNSDYSPSQDRIRYGDGGVDDSDDGEIVVHEYGHAIHNDIVPGFVYSGESGAISEGFGDYFSAALGNNALCGEWDATAYNPGPPPFLRRTDTTKHYPEDWAGEVHDDGEIISAAWWDLRNLVGPTVGDQLVIEGMFYTGTTATFQDYADGIVAADQALYGGAHVGYIFQAFGGRGIGPNYLLSFNHTPQGDTEDLAGPYHLVTTITHTSPVTAADAVKAYYRYGNAGAFTEIVLAPTGGFDEWAGDIPGPGVIGTVEYYLSVTDDMAVSATLPSTAPAGVFTFVTGPDSQAPVITHLALTDKPLLVWPATVSATITDNGAISSATVEYSLNGVAQTPLAMTPLGGGQYSVAFPEPAANLVAGDEFTYTIVAVDGSSMANTTTHGPHTFHIIDALGVVLIISDDAAAAAQGDIKYDENKQLLPEDDRSVELKSASSTAMAAVLQAAGWVVYQETAAATNPATWPTYSFIIASAGANTGPVANATYRAALEAYVAAGHKLLLEGGEVAYDAISSPGYPTFKTNVVHGTTWNSDNAGPLVIRTGMATHPIVSTPFAVTGPLALTYAGYGDEDAFVPASDAYAVLGTTNYPNSAGLLVYDNNPDPGSAQIVFFAFNYAALTDQANAANLLQNAALFLVTPEVGGTASIAGEVTVEGGSDGGVLITANPGGFTTTTAPNGTYTITGLYANTYTVTATLAGYGSSPQTVTLAAGEHRTGVNFGLGAITSYQYCVSPNLAIPDNNTTGISSQILVTDGDILVGLTVEVNVTHTWKGDLVVELTSPAGTTVRLHNRTGSSTDNIVAHYGVDTNVDGPGTLADFAGPMPVGDWTLHVWDAASSDTGRLNSWCLNTKVTNYVVANEVPDLTIGQSAGRPQLSWNVLPGLADGFNVYRRTAAETRTRLNDVPLTGRDGHVDFIDQTAMYDVGTVLYYSLGVVRDGIEFAAGPEVEYRMGAGMLPTAFVLHGNFPNPFNPMTTIKFDLPRDGHVALRIYDLSGRVVRTLVDENLARAAHEYRWDGSDDAGHRVASGTYYYRVETDQQNATGKMMLVK